MSNQAKRCMNGINAAGNAGTSDTSSRQRNFSTATSPEPGPSTIPGKQAIAKRHHHHTAGNHRKMLSNNIVKTSGHRRRDDDRNNVPADAQAREMMTMMMMGARTRTWRWGQSLSQVSCRAA
jgi:hypothetical protein